MKDADTMIVTTRPIVKMQAIVFEGLTLRAFEDGDAEAFVTAALPSSIACDPIVENSSIDVRRSFD